MHSPQNAYEEKQEDEKVSCVLFSSICVCPFVLFVLLAFCVWREGACAPICNLYICVYLRASQRVFVLFLHVSLLSSPLTYLSVYPSDKVGHQVRTRHRQPARSLLFSIPKIFVLARAVVVIAYGESLGGFSIAIHTNHYKVCIVVEECHTIVRFVYTFYSLERSTRAKHKKEKKREKKKTANRRSCENDRSDESMQKGFRDLRRRMNLISNLTC